MGMDDKDNDKIDNKSVALILREIALFKDLNGENPFKVRAFENAARTLERLDRSVGELVVTGELFSIKGIGKQIGSTITEIVKTGKARELDELKKKFPSGITELLSIPGMGPKKVKAVWEKLGISNIGELEYACLENRLVSLDGFGKKSQEKILAAIDFIRHNSAKRLFSEALSVANGIIENLKLSKIIDRATIAGSLRRGKTTFKDIDILVVPKEISGLEEVKRLLLKFADPEEKGGIIGVGDTKISIRVDGLQVDFRIVREESYASALQHFTGSKEHNTILRSRAKSLGFKMNEYGLFRIDGGKSASADSSNLDRVSVNSEEEVYRAIGLKWIPPELREGYNEVEMAERGLIPSLVTKADMKGVVHVHSTYSDGANTLEELAEYCIEEGFSYLCISDHSKAAYYAGGLNEDNLRAQKEEIVELNERYSPFRIFWGIEADILPDGNLDYSEEILRDFDFVIASIHSGLSMGIKEATNRLIRAVSNPYTTILGHPTGRLLLSREGYPVDWDALLSAMVEYGVALEINSNPHRLDPDWPILKRAGEMGILISVNPDAHSLEGIEDIAYGVVMARKAWLTPNNILNCMDTGKIEEFFGAKSRAGGK